MYNFVNRRREDTDELNISPLIDMIFILLIFFVVTTSFSRETGVEVNKPKASTAKTLSQENILIAVTSEGTIHILEKQVDLNQLSMIVKRLLNENPERQVIVFADRLAPSGEVVDVIDVCNLSGVKKVNIAAIKK
ncbi:MAG: biopolymer transporter ExbD [Spirochaetota bacterium]|nr:biopolymer transporter ExbD [Spirochaetota bacterium]